MIVSTVALTAALNAIKNAMPKNDVRLYMNGIRFECNGTDRVRLVATDGHRIAVADVLVADNTEAPTEPWAFTMCQSMLVPVLANLKVAGMTTELKVGSVDALPVRHLEGNYPNVDMMFSKVRPNDAHMVTQPLLINAKYMQQGCDAMGKLVTLGKGKGAVVVTNTDAMLILIEPYRIDIPLLENAKVLIAKVKA